MAEKFPIPELIKVNVGELRKILDLNLRGLDEKGYTETAEYAATKGLLDDLAGKPSAASANDKESKRFKNIIADNRALSEGKSKGPLSAFK
jgi:hypothetical protein